MKSFNDLIDFLAMDLDDNDFSLFADEALLSTNLTHLFINSTEVVPGSVFIALPGARHHGISFLEQALEQGAACVLTSQQPQQDIDSPTPILFVENLEERVAGLADWFYERPSQKTKIIGITGTNGKTSTAHYLAQLLNQTHSVAVLGTLGNGILGELLPSMNTTLEVVSLNRKLHEFVQLGVDYVVMEVSSHAIALGRIQNIRFEALALTQVTRDHLDFHETEEAYRQTKARLFLDYPAKFRVLNLEDPLGKSLVETLAQSVGEKVFAYALDKVLCQRVQEEFLAATCAALSCSAFAKVDFEPTGISGQVSMTYCSGSDQVDYPNSLLSISSSLIGGFNAENLLCALTVAYGCGLDAESLEKGVKQLTSVSGRMQKVFDHPLILIDYAHTPDALDSALKAVRQHFTNDEMSLWLVFGCGGDRDKGKRPLMGGVAERLADHIILTDDNPRNEEPEQIVEQIRQGMSPSAKAETIHDRAQAIEYAIQHAVPNDVVLIAGKGHENYQEIQGQRFFMSDAVLVDLTLREMQQETQHDSHEEGGLS